MTVKILKSEEGFTYIAALVLVVVGGVIAIDGTSLGQFMISRPFVAGTLGTMGLTFLAPWLVKVALAFGPAEYFCLMGEDDRGKLAIAEADGDGPIQRFLAGEAKRHGIWLIGGTLPIRSADGRRVRNACCVYAPDGTRAALGAPRSEP